MDALIQGRADCYGELACRPGAAEEQVVLSSGEDDAESLNSVATRSPTVRGFEEISTPNPSGFRLAADAVLALVAQLATNVEALRRVARFGSPPAADSTLGEVGGRKHRRNSNAWENALVSKVQHNAHKCARTDGQETLHVYDDKSSSTIDESISVIPASVGTKPAKLTVVLDLDDTLVCTFRKDFAPYHIRHGLGSAARLTCHELHYGKGEAIDSPITGEVLVVERPDLLEFLRSIKSFADIVLFTAGIESYAAPIVKRIDPTGTIFNAVLFRGATVNLAGQENVKDLAAVGSSIERTVLLDNNPFSFVAQPCNGIPVVPFAGDPHDRNLMSKLLPVLKELAEEPDVRPVLRSRYNVEEWLIQRGYQVAPQP